MKSQKKILILINNPIIFRSYIKTNSLKGLTKKFNCKFLISTNVLENFDVRDARYFKYTERQTVNSKISNIFLREIFRKRNLSSSFFFISKVWLTKIKLVYKHEKLSDIILRFPKRLIAKVGRYILFFFRTSFIFKLFDLNYLKNLDYNSEIYEAFKNFKPDLAIVPFQSYEGDSIYSTFKICKDKKIDCLGIIDNWDNIFSKPLIQPKPNFLTVWGKQGSDFAKAKHNYTNKNLFKLGTPRFNHYFLDRRKKLKNPFNKKYILFIEGWCWDGLDIVLEKLNNLVNKYKQFKNHKIIYRPHPWRKDWHILNVKKLKNVIIDPQLKKNYLKKNFSTLVQPDIKYYSSLIKNADLVVSGPSSMVVESMIFNKKILLLGHDSKSFYNHNNFLKYVENYKGIEKYSFLKVQKFR